MIRVLKVTLEVGEGGFVNSKDIVYVLVESKFVIVIKFVPVAQVQLIVVDGVPEHEIVASAVKPDGFGKVIYLFVPSDNEFSKLRLMI